MLPAGKKHVVYLLATFGGDKMKSKHTPVRTFVSSSTPSESPEMPATLAERAALLKQPQEQPLRRPDVMLNLKHVATEIRIKTRRVLRLRHVRCCEWGVRCDFVFPIHACRSDGTLTGRGRGRG